MEGQLPANHQTSLRPPDRSPAAARRPIFGRLHPGPGQSAEAVAADQRLRLRQAMVELVGERGYEGVTVRTLAELSNVSTRSFYQRFPGTEACFSYTYGSLLRSSLRRTHVAHRRGGGRPEGIRDSLRSVLEELAWHPPAARLVLIEAFAPGLGMQPVMRKGVAGFERLLAASLATDLAAPQRSRHLLLGLAAGVTRAARARVEAGTTIDVAALGGELGDWLLAIAQAGAPDSGRTTASFPEAQIDRAAAWDAERFGRIGEERGRLLAATARLALGEGYRSLTGPRIRATAGVSRRSFDAHFADVGDCFLATVETVAAAAGRRAAHQLAGAGDWERGLRRAVAALCMEAAHDPALARLVFVELLGAGLRGLRHRERMIAAAASHLRAAAPADRRPRPVTAEASVAAAWQIAQVEVAAGRAGRLPALAPILARLLAA